MIINELHQHFHKMKKYESSLENGSSCKLVVLVLKELISAHLGKFNDPWWFEVTLESRASSETNPQ